MHVRIDWERAVASNLIRLGLFEILARQTYSALGTGRLPEATGLVLSNLNTSGLTAAQLLKSVCDELGYAFHVRFGELYLVNTLGAAARPIIVRQDG